MLKNNNISFWLDFIKVVFSYPLTFFRYVSAENYRRLVHAVRNEPPSRIIKNFKNLLIRTKNTSPQNIKNRINKFLNNFELPEDKEVILFVTHEVTRTGAPLIILKIAEDLAKLHNVFPIILVCNSDGELESTFRKVGPTYDIVHWNETVLLKWEMNHLIQGLKEKFDVKTAYVNSAESRQILPYFHKNGIEKVITLVHEMGNYYPKDSWKIINDNSDKVVFPANFVKRLAMENSAFDESKTIVKGQGLLKPEILDADLFECRASIRTELGLPENSIIILGCGTPIPRKGIDIFVLTATSVLNNYKGDAPIYFIWLGDGPANEYQLWTQRDIEQSGWQENIRFLNSREDTIPFFVGSDVFFMTSRGDPLPCVVHEALAAGLPVVAFENAGGFVEILDKHEVIPYGDLTNASNTITKLCEDKMHRQMLAHHAREKAEAFSFEAYSNFIYHINKNG